MDLGYLPDIVRSDVINFDSMPDKAKEILALRAVGLGATKIGRLMKMNHETVRDYLERYDPKGLCRVTPEQKRVITTEMLMGVGVDALLEITDEKMAVMDAKDCSIIATRCIAVAEKIRALDKGVSKIKTELDSAMDYFEIEEQDGE